MTGQAGLWILAADQHEFFTTTDPLNPRSDRPRGSGRVTVASSWGRPTTKEDRPRTARTEVTVAFEGEVTSPSSQYRMHALFAAAPREELQSSPVMPM